jgi:transcriptional regulator with XRE-family HTH domain
MLQETNMKFGDYLRQKREAQGWTQPEAAARADIEQSYLSKLETGKSYPSEDIFNRLTRAYDIDAADITANVFSSELDKLREIKEVREVVLTKQKQETKLTRGWLVAGLACLMIGGACLGLVVVDSGPASSRQEFHYKSVGELKNDEPLDAFDIVGDTITGSSPLVPELKARQLEMIDRIHERIESHERYRGPSYITKTFSGRRVYTLFDSRTYDVDSPFKWLFAPALMFLAGSFGCFFISFRWK